MSYYDEQQIGTIEIVTLAEDIILPELPYEELTHDYLRHIGPYTLAFNVYKNMMGKFFLPIMTPLVDKGDIMDQGRGAPSTRGHRGASLRTSDYTSANYILLPIPKYILLNFRDKVPKGTKFIMASIGGSLDTDKMRIVGLYTVSVEEGE